jgi:hypothetical protein
LLISAIAKGKPPMLSDRTVNVGRDSVGNVITTGDKNQMEAKIDAALVKTTLPPANSIEISWELTQIRTILERLGGEHAGKIGRALDDAAEEARKPQPNKDEVGTALGRALNYAKEGSAFADELQKLVPHVTNAVAWLGSNWHKHLPLVGLAL